MNSSNSFNDDLLVHYFNNTGPHLDNIAFTSIKFGVALLAILFSASIIHLTSKTKQLREMYNLLILANSMASIGYMTNSFWEWLIALSGLNLIQRRHCYGPMILPIFSSQCQIILYLVLGIDRLVLVLAPIWHRLHVQNHQKECLFGLFAGVFVYAAAMAIFGIPYSLFEETANDLVTCGTADPVPKFIFTHVAILLNLGSLLCYFFIWILLICRDCYGQNHGPGTNSNARKVLKSLLVGFMLEFLGWFANTLTRMSCDWLNVSTLRKWYLMSSAGILLYASLAIYAPILYTINPEYKKAFKQMYGFSFPAFSFTRMSTNSVNGGRMTTIIVQPQQQQCHPHQPMTIRIHPLMAKESFSPIARPE